jgi:hypothetical protein
MPRDGLPIPVSAAIDCGNSNSTIGTMLVHFSPGGTGLVPGMHPLWHPYNARDQ